MSFEKQYFKQVYANDLSQFPSIASKYNRRKQYRYNLNDTLSRNDLYAFRGLLGSSDRSNTSLRYIDESESESIRLSFHRLGIESASVSSILNLRNRSYLNGRDNDCIDTLLMQMEAANQANAQPATPAAATTLQLEAADNDDEAQAKQRACWTRVRQSALFRCATYAKVLNPIGSQSSRYLSWLAIVAFFYIYNVISISFRYSFDYDNDDQEDSDNNSSRLLVLSMLLRNNASQTQNATPLVRGSLRESNSSLAWKLDGSELISQIGNKSRLDFYEANANTSGNLLLLLASPLNQLKERMVELFQVAETKTLLWRLVDYTSDLIYLVDTFLVQTRIKFIKDGLWVSELKFTSLQYFKSTRFHLDIASILPFDLLQLVLGMNVLTRLNRCLRIKSLWEFFDRWDRSVQSYVFIVRLIRLFVYLQIVIHLYACAYYSISQWEVRTMHVQNDWVYGIDHSKINNYVYSFLFGLKTASTIGNNPQPHTKYEYLFTAIAYVVALFLFALIVGQIRNIIGSLSTKQDSFLIVLDTTIKFVKSLNLPIELTSKVINWFDFYVNEQEAIPFEAISFLPINLQTELAIAVYFELLSKVKLFQECEKNLLYSLVLKLKPVIFMPGDFICKKGDVGREMFIVDKGVVEVVVEGRAVAQMKVGSYFGEISLLSMGDGGNRRTANVVSKGFSRLLVLEKRDLNEVLKSYAGMEEILRKAANSYLKKK